jgi:ABC-type branched-subunit amino acid transport system substrate-binding protein
VFFQKNEKIGGEEKANLKKISLLKRRMEKKMNKKVFFKKLLAISLSLMLVLTLGAFSGFSQEEEKEIRIGAIVALSGPLSQFGPDWLKAGEIAVEDMNRVGGPLGQKVKLYAEDSETDVEEGIKAAKKLIPINKVIAIYGPTSGVVVGIMDFCENNKVPVISGVSGSSRLDKVGGKYQYRTCSSDSYEGIVDAAFTYDELGIKRVSLITLNDEGTLSVARTFKEEYKKLGGEILEDILVNPGQATYMSSIELAFKSKPEGVMVSADMDVTAVIIKEWQRAGYGGKMLCGSDIGPGKFVDNVEGVYYTFIASDPNTIPYQVFKAKFEALTSRGLGYGVPNCYDAMVLYGLAIQAAGEATGEAIAENMRRVANPPGVVVHSFADGKAALLLGQEINYEGASGPCDFDEYGNVSGGYAKYVFDSNGEGVLVKYYPPGVLE